MNADGEPFTNLQGLRATGASIADAAGVPESIIEAQLGHTGGSVYRRHYRDVRRAAERFQFADVFEPTDDTDPVALDQKLDQRGARGHLQLVLGGMESQQASRL